MSNTQRATLAPDVAKRLRSLVDSADEKTSARARLILRSYEGISVAEIATEVGMSQSGVRHWLKQFRERGVTALEGKDTAPQGQSPESVPAVAEPEPEAVAAPVEKTSQPAPEPAPKSTRGRRKRVEPEADPVQSTTQSTSEESKSGSVKSSPVRNAPVVGAEPPATSPTKKTPAKTEPKARRGRRKGAAQSVDAEPAEAAPAALPTEVESVEPSALPDVEILTPAPKPAKSRRGRKSASAAAESIPVAIPETTPEPEPVASEETPDEAAKPQKPRRGRASTKRVQVEETPPAPPPITTVRELVDKYGVNMAHAEYVTANAYRLFDETAEIHRLPDHERRLLQAGALLHGVADNIDLENHHERARDIILETPLEHFTSAEQAMIALIAAFHRKKVHPERESIFTQLPEMLQRDTLSLAAILRIADGLDASQTQSTEIADVSYSGREITILVTGEQSIQDAQRARSKADLWLQQFGQHAIIEPMPEQGLEIPEIPILSAPPMLRDQIPDLIVNLDPSMSAARAVRKIGLHYADRVERFAAMVRAGDERRLDALERELERLEGVLMLAGERAYVDTLLKLHASVGEAMIAFELFDRALVIADDPDEPGAATVAARMDSWRDSALEKLRDLDLDQLGFVLGEIRRELVNEPSSDSGALITTLAAPAVWRQLSDLRDIVERGESVTDALTAARRLQDYLLYFRSLIGPESVQALDMLVPFEGFLGAIRVAQEILGILGVDQASVQLRTSQENVLNELADELPSIWSSINSIVFRRAIALALAAA